MARGIRPTLRFLISAVCAFIVLVVATITLVITLTTSTATIRDIGEEHATSLANTATLQVEGYLRNPSVSLRSLGDTYSQGHLTEGTRAPDKELYANRTWRALYNAALGSNFSFTSLGVIFDDWTGCRINGYGVTSAADPDLIFAQVVAYEGYNGYRPHVFSFGVSASTGRMVPGYSRPPITDLTADPRFPAFASAKQIAGTDVRSFSVGISLYPLSEHDVAFTLAVVRPIFNVSGSVIGLAALAVSIARTVDFITELKGTPDTQVFLLDGLGYIFGSTHSTPFFTLTNYNPSASAPSILPTGCTNSGDSADVPYPSVYVACRSSAAAFTAYPPVTEVASDRTLMRPASRQVRRMNLDGGNYFVVASPIRSNIRFLEVTILLFMPEEDVLGGITRARNVAIGVTAAVFVVAVAAVFALVFLLLQPLTEVSQQMLSTARLHESAAVDRQNFSSVAEIQDLQKAYANMDTAIQSFTRYVPRDVVKDLMSSGQLCTIQMTPQRCSMLFVDIAGFTTVCERVPPDVLSDLVSAYFDRASRIVMEHDGLIDKFIGDCIMAVWGAPFAVTNQEVKATLAAKMLDRETAIDPLVSQWDEAGELLRVRVGVSTGEVLAGNMGSADRMNYTVIGDPVNLAARLESLNKQFGTRVMVSEMTAEGLHGAFVLRLLMPIAVVGKEKPVKVYEVMGVVVNVGPDVVDVLQLNDAGHVRNAQDDSSDMASVVSRVSTTVADAAAEMQQQTGGLGRGGAPRYRVSARSTIDMLREAQRLSAATPLSITCTDAEVAFAAAHTAAVHKYMAGDFAGACAAIDALRTATPQWILTGADVPVTKSTDATNNGSGGGVIAAVRTSGAAKSVELLLDVCSHYIQHGRPHDFDGVYRALEK